MSKTCRRCNHFSSVVLGKNGQIDWKRTSSRFGKSTLNDGDIVAALLSFPVTRGIRSCSAGSTASLDEKCIRPEERQTFRTNLRTLKELFGIN